MINYNVQLMCLALLIFIGIYHSQCKRLPTRNVRLFNQIILVSIGNTVFEMITIYMMHHVGDVPEIINYFSRKLYFLSFNLDLYLICCYIILITENQRKRSRRVKILQVLPMVCIFFLPLCIPTVVFYLAMNLYYIVRYFNDIEIRKRKLVIPAIGILIIVTLFQIIYHQIPITGFGIMIVVISILFSLGNPDAYVDTKRMLYTAEGFHLILNDLFRDKKYFKVISVYIKNINEIRDEHGLAVECILLKEVHKLIAKKYGIDLFLPFDGCVSSIIKKENEEKLELEDLPRFLAQGFHIKDSTIYLNYEIRYVDCNACHNPEEVLEQIFKTANKIQYVRTYTDVPTGLCNRNAYEKDMKHIFNLRKEFGLIWYIILNLNNLQQINEQMGHNQGDNLLRNCALILTKIISKNHRVYHLEGEEFCVIILDESQQQVESLLAQLEQERQSTNKTGEVPISFALGYSKFQPESDIDLSEVRVRAEKMMYQIKNIMNRK